MPSSGYGTITPEPTVGLRHAQTAPATLTRIQSRKDRIDDILDNAARRAQEMHVSRRNSNEDGFQVSSPSSESAALMDNNTNNTPGQPGGSRPSSRTFDVRPEPWYTTFLSAFQSIELENKGSVARDHLAIERTFLAWLRTSLTFASLGIAISQLFRLNTALREGNKNNDKVTRLRNMGKPLGVAFIGLSIFILIMGFLRFQRSSKWVIQGKFPTSRGSVVMVSILTLALMLVSLSVVFSLHSRI